MRDNVILSRMRRGDPYESLLHSVSQLKKDSRFSLALYTDGECVESPTGEIMDWSEIERIIKLFMEKNKDKLSGVGVREDNCSTLLEHLRTLYDTPSSGMRLKSQQDLSIFASFLSENRNKEMTRDITRPLVSENINKEMTRDITRPGGSGAHNISDDIVYLDKVYVYFISLVESMTNCLQGTAERLGTIIVSIHPPRDLAELIGKARYLTCRYIAAAAAYGDHSVHAMERFFYHLGHMGIKLPASINTATFSNGRYKWGNDLDTKLREDFAVDKFIDCMKDILKQLVGEIDELPRYFPTESDATAKESANELKVEILKLLKKYVEPEDDIVTIEPGKLEDSVGYYKVGVNWTIVRLCLARAMKVKYFKRGEYVIFISDMLVKFTQQNDKCAIGTILMCLYSQDLVELMNYYISIEDSTNTSSNFRSSILQIALYDFIILDLKKVAYYNSPLLGLLDNNKLGLEHVKELDENLWLEAIAAAKIEPLYSRECLVHALSKVSLFDMGRIYKYLAYLSPLSDGDSYQCEWETKQLLYAWYLSTTDVSPIAQLLQATGEAKVVKDARVQAIEEDMKLAMLAGKKEAKGKLDRLVKARKESFFEDFARYEGTISNHVVQSIVAICLDYYQEGCLKEVGPQMTSLIYTKDFLGDEPKDRLYKIRAMYQKKYESLALFNLSQFMQLSWVGTQEEPYKMSHGMIVVRIKLLLSQVTSYLDEHADLLVFNEPLITKLIALLATRSSLGGLYSKSSLSSSKVDDTNITCSDSDSIRISCLMILHQLIQSAPVKANQLGNQILPQLDQLIDQLLGLSDFSTKEKKQGSCYVYDIISELSKNIYAADMLIKNKKIQDFLKGKVIINDPSPYDEVVLSLAHHAVTSMSFDQSQMDDFSLLFCLIHMLNRCDTACVSGGVAQASSQAGDLDHGRVSKLMLHLADKQNAFDDDRFLSAIEHHYPIKNAVDKVLVYSLMFNLMAKELSLYLYENKKNPPEEDVSGDDYFDFTSIVSAISALIYFSSRMHPGYISTMHKGCIDVLIDDIGQAIEHLKGAESWLAINVNSMYRFISWYLMFARNVLICVHMAHDSTPAGAVDKFYRFLISQQFITPSQKFILRDSRQLFLFALQSCLSLKHVVTDEDIRALIGLLNALYDQAGESYGGSLANQFELLLNILLHEKLLNSLDNDGGIVFDLLCNNKRENECQDGLSLVDHIAVPTCNVLSKKGSEYACAGGDPLSDLLQQIMRRLCPSDQLQQTIRFCRHLINYLQSKQMQPAEFSYLLTAPVQKILIAFGDCSDHSIELSLNYLQVFTEMIKKLDQSSPTISAICSSSQLIDRLLSAAQDTLDNNRMLAAQKIIFELLTYPAAADLLLDDSAGNTSFKDYLKRLISPYASVELRKLTTHTEEKQEEEEEEEANSGSIALDDTKQEVFTTIVGIPSVLAKLVDAHDICNMCENFIKHPPVLLNLLKSYALLESVSSLPQEELQPRFLTILTLCVDQWSTLQGNDAIIAAQGNDAIIAAQGNNAIIAAIAVIAELLVKCKAVLIHMPGLFPLLEKFRELYSDCLSNRYNDVRESIIILRDYLHCRINESNKPKMQQEIPELCCVYAYLQHIFEDLKQPFKDQEAVLCNDVTLYIAALKQLSSNSMQLDNEQWRNLIRFVLYHLIARARQLKQTMESSEPNLSGLPKPIIDLGDILRSLYNARDALGEKVEGHDNGYKNSIIQHIDETLDTLRILPSQQFEIFNSKYETEKAKHQVTSIFGRGAGRNALSVSGANRLKIFNDKLRSPRSCTTKKVYDAMVKGGSLMSADLLASPACVAGAQDQAVVDGGAGQSLQAGVNR